MKNKNGFIATSILYSFFVVFLLLSLFIISTYENNRLLNDALNSNILNNLNEHISSQYINITNSIPKEFELGSIKNAYISTDNNDKDIVLDNENGNGSTATITFNLINSIPNDNNNNSKLIYVSYLLYSENINTSFNNNSGITLSMTTEKIPFPSSNNWANNFNNTLHSKVIKVAATDIMEPSTIIFTIAANDKTTLHIRELRVIDVTGIVECKDNETDCPNLDNIKEYLDKKLPSLVEDYQIKKL